MSSLPLTAEQRAQKWGTVAKIAAVAALGFLVSPFVLSAIQGVLGLLALAAIYGTVWVTLPAIGDAAKNLRLKLVRAEAARDPIGTLQNEHLRQSAMLEERKIGMETSSGAIRSLNETIRKLEAEFPDSPELPQMRQDYADLRAIEQQRADQWAEAYVTLGMFKKEIERAKRVWDVALALAKARGASGLSEEEWQATLKRDTSFDAIRLKLNSEMSALSTEKMQADADRILKGKVAAKALPSGTDRPVINVTGTAAASVVRAS